MPKDDWNRPKRQVQWYANYDIDVPEKTQTTYKQRKYLKSLGMHENDIKKLTRIQAINEIDQRRGHSSYLPDEDLW